MRSRLEVCRALIAARGLITRLPVFSVNFRADGRSAHHLRVHGPRPARLQDTGDNAADFISVNARLDVCCDPNSVLGMAGPQNLESPTNRGAATPLSLLDPATAASGVPNRERNATVVPNRQFGTLRFRRTVTNNTGQPITRLRIRVIDITTLQSQTAPAPAKATPCASPCGDLRLLSSSDEAAIATSGGPVSTSGTTLELAAYQTIGGGYNSSLNVNQVVEIIPVAPGGSINVNILLGVRRTGNVRFFVTVEALTEEGPVDEPPPPAE